MRLKQFIQSLILFTLLAGTLVLGTGCSTNPIEPSDSVDHFTSYLDQRVPVLMARLKIPGVSIALIRDGELVWSGAYGYADLEEERAMTVDTVCRAESISKSVTAWGIMRLVEKVQLDLDVPIQEYLIDWDLPETAFDDKGVTVRRLLSNTAGLSNGTIGEEYSPQSVLPTLEENLTQEARLVQQPGRSFLYSNPGFNLLELITEEVTGQEFSSFMEDEVLHPLGMLRASYRWRDEYQLQLPMGYEMNGSPVPAYIYPAAGSGGLFANVEDLANFVRAEMIGPYAADQAILSLEGIQQIQEPEVEIPGLFGFVADWYGFGHFIEVLADGRQAVWHGGQGHGWMTHFHAVPESGAGIVIVTNSQRSWPFIAEMLSYWAQWNDLGRLKFTIINQSTLIVKILAGAIILFSLWQLFQVIKGLRSGKYGFAPLAPESRVLRSTQALFGMAVIAGLSWSVAQPYLFVSSIFPGTINWLAGGLLFLAVVNIMAACFPERADGQG
jgi:CubicO group peptidase (beta-lactamase class C family)